MRQTEFRQWLRAVYVKRSGGQLDERSCNSRMATCATAERYEGDLDGHFERDGMSDLTARLTYSTDDERQKRKPRHRVPIRGNVRTGSSNLKSSVLLYQQFCQFVQDNGKIPASVPHGAPAPKSSSPGRSSAAKWPQWSRPDENVILALARALTPFVRFLHPDVVAAIAEDNNHRRKSWGSQLHDCGIDPQVYLWESSPCAFPGIRRYAGSKEIARYRGHAGSKDDHPADALRLDDNDFPKHVWSFLFRGKPFQKFGPQGYALAHLADHKEHNNRCAEEFEMPDGGEAPDCFFGLYTSAANAAYVPTNFLKPTDFNGTMRTMLQRRAFDLYGSVCNVMPPPLRVKNAPSPEWETEQFTWAEPIGTTTNLKDFLEYRARIIDELLVKRLN